MMSERQKRLLIIGSFIVLSLLIALLLFYLIFRAPFGLAPEEILEEVEEELEAELPEAEVGVPTVIEEEEVGGLPISVVAEGGLTKVKRLTSSQVVAPILSSDGQSVSYYDPSTGRFYTINSKGEVDELSSATFPEAETIVWSDLANKVAVEFPDGTNVIYDFESQKQTTLPSHWEDFDFSSDGKEVAAKSLATDPNASVLVITNADSSQTQAVAALGLNANLVEVNWSPNDQVIAFSNTGTEQSGFGRSMIVPIGKNKENFDGLIVEGLNFHSKWTPDGKRLVYDVTGSESNFKPTLWVVDATAATMGENRRSLSVNTWVEKCVFADSSTLYCAVPLLLPDDAGLQPGLVKDEDDAVYRIDLEGGAVRLIGIPVETTAMENLAISDDGSLLYYTDEKDRLSFMRLR